MAIRRLGCVRGSPCPPTSAWPRSGRESGLCWACLVASPRAWALTWCETWGGACVALTTLWVLAGGGPGFGHDQGPGGGTEPVIPPSVLGPRLPFTALCRPGLRARPLPHVLEVWRPRPLAPAGLCEGWVYSGEGVRAGTLEAGASAASGLSCVALGRSAPPGLGSSSEDDAVPACSASCCELRNEQALQKVQLAILGFHHLSLPQSQGWEQQF